MGLLHRRIDPPVPQPERDLGIFQRHCRGRCHVFPPNSGRCLSRSRGQVQSSRASVLRMGLVTLPSMGVSEAEPAPDAFQADDWLCHVTKSFGALKAVDDVSLDIAEGEFLAIVGGSGSGKTTLLRLANRLIEADGGTITVEGEDVQTRRSGRAAAPHRLRLPERRAVSASERRRQYRDHAKTARRAGGRDRRARRRAARAGAARPRRPSRPAAAMHSRAGSASASAWRGRWRQGPASC